ncbi:alpha/beta hydrolase [Sphingomonas qomolangmaensis]|uniref:Alpha/beta hydrolase n=1 Tax=Sphingomonas qomolangmaensis TaxID=2918765 RepID=A0ABY5LDE5_9SPHN|nr:alpha/beta hydrolase [Sphingomonas qomolangmaensis]UUL82741.1 alpha/beta hydrolase [Sphingomonas qomolangmaensis]
MFRPALFAALLLAGCATTPPPAANGGFTPMRWPALTERAKPAPDATIAYGADAMHKVDVWLPAGTGPHPTVVMVHGGCWTSSIADRSLMNWISDDLRRDGIAVWNVEYRGIDLPGGGYPGTFHDVAAATDALRTHAAKYRLDTRRIVAVGHSAGGHLALWLAARPKLPAGSALRTDDPLPIAHVVSLGGLPDLEATAAATDNGCGVEVVGKLVGPSPTERGDVYADTSVTRLLPIGVPHTQIVGREDRIIPIRLPQGFDAAARAAGDDATLTIVPGTGHVELIAPETAAWGQAKRAIRKALQP